MKDKFKLYAIVKDYFYGLNRQAGRRALIHVLGGGNIAIAATDILIYLICQTYDTDQELLDKYDGYIVRTNEQIELATGCTKFNNSMKHVDLLTEKGLIERDFKSSCAKSRYRVNIDKVISELDAGLTQIDEKNVDYTNKQNGIKYRRWLRSNIVDAEWRVLRGIVQDVSLLNKINESLFEDDDAVSIYEALVKVINNKLTLTPSIIYDFAHIINSFITRDHINYLFTEVSESLDIATAIIILTDYQKTKQKDLELTETFYKSVSDRIERRNASS